MEPQKAPAFSQAIDELISITTCRPILDEADKEEVYRLRYAAYHREGALPPHAPRRFCDAFDAEPNTLSFGVYVGDRLCSSLRLHVVDRETPYNPGMQVYDDYLKPWLSRGEVLIDPTRFVVDADASRAYPKLPYVTVRIAWMASEWFGADRLLATVRAEHQAFYKRLFGHEVVCPPRPYPTLTKPLSLMALSLKAQQHRVLARYGFFKSSLAEQEALFGGWAKRPRPRLTIEAPALPFPQVLAQAAVSLGCAIEYSPRDASSLMAPA